ncbi:putative NAD-dependent DNA ligase protein [Vibrio phage PG288]|nr:putative NAD-dependent DNA ligase protein [Vibrio phage PG288]
MRRRERRTADQPAIMWEWEDLKDNPNKVVSALLTSSYLYYLRSDLRPIMRDEDFDLCCKLLRRRYREVTHMHKSLIKMSDLRAGTLFRLRDHDYPTITKVVAVELSLGTINDMRLPTPQSAVKNATTSRRTRNKAAPRRERSRKKGFL